MVVPGVNVNGDPATYLKGWIVIACKSVVGCTLSSKKKKQMNIYTFEFYIKFKWLSKNHFTQNISIWTLSFNSSWILPLLMASSIAYQSM